MHHGHNEPESEQAPGDSEGQGSLACCSPWGREESNMTEQLNNITLKGLPGWLSSEESTCSGGDTRDAGSIPGSGRSSGGRYGKPPQYCCLKNLMDREAWRVTVHGITKNWIQ